MPVLDEDRSQHGRHGLRAGRDVKAVVELHGVFPTEATNTDDGRLNAVASHDRGRQCWQTVLGTNALQRLLEIDRRCGPGRRR